MEILNKHGLQVSVEDVSREIQSAIQMVGGNRRYAQRHTKFAWIQYHNIATVQGAGPLAVLSTVIDQALTDATEMRASALPDAQLTQPQLALLRAQRLAAGTTSSSIDPCTRTVIKLGAMCSTGFTSPQVARLLHCGPAQIEEWVGTRRLYGLAVASGATPRLPLFQFDNGGGLIPNVDKVLPALDRDIHPVGIFNWFTAPNPDLATLETDFEPISPRDWLLRDYPAEPVSRLADALSGGTPA